MKLTLLLTSFLLVGCLPDRLVPHDFSIEKNNLEAYIELDSMTISMFNLKVERDHLVFGMEIENKSSLPIFLDMAKVRKYANDYSYRSKQQLKTYQEVVSAMTPMQVNKFFEMKKRQADGAAFLLFLVGAAISTYDAIKDNEDNNKSSWTSEDQRKSTTRDLVTTSALIATDVLSEVAFQSHEAAATELRYLPKELFDREVIYPNETYFGKVLFKKIGPLKRHHRITVPLEDDKFHFDFRKATPKEKEFLQRQ